MKSSLEKLSNEEVRVRVIHAGVGAINESDILLASTAGAIVVGFNVRPDAAAAASAHRANVDMRFYRVIYDAIDEIEAAMKGMLAPKFEEVVIGHAEVRHDLQGQRHRHHRRLLWSRTARSPGILRCAFCGTTSSSTKARSAPCSASRTTVKEVTAGYECGMSVVKYNDIKEGDIFECFVMQEVKR